MPQNDLEIRVEFLEKTVAGLTGLPQQVHDLSTQFLQFREEVAADISGVRVDLRGEMRDLRDELRGEMHDIRDELRGEMHDIRDELVGRIDSCRDELREDMASMHQDLAKIIVANHTQMLTLHEHLIERITLLGDGLKATSLAPPPDGVR